MEGDTVVTSVPLVEAPSVVCAVGLPNGTSVLASGAGHTITFYGFGVASPSPLTLPPVEVNPEEAEAWQALSQAPVVEGTEWVDPSVVAGCLDALARIRSRGVAGLTKRSCEVLGLKTDEDRMAMITQVRHEPLIVHV